MLAAPVDGDVRGLDRQRHNALSFEGNRDLAGADPDRPIGQNVQCGQDPEHERGRDEGKQGAPGE